MKWVAFKPKKVLFRTQPYENYKIITTVVKNTQCTKLKIRKIYNKLRLNLVALFFWKV